MTESFQTNTKVEWDWGNGTGTGYVREVHRDTVEKEIKGSTITRHASDDDPAYTVEQEDGDVVLKSHTELRRAS